MKRNGTITSIARKAGLSRQYCSRLLQKGHTVPEVLGWRKAHGAHQGRQRSGALPIGALPMHPSGSSVSAESFSEAQRRKEIALADKHQLDVAERRGQLVTRHRFDFAVQSIAVALQQALAPLGRDISDAIRNAPPGADQIVIEETVRKCVGDALYKVAGFVATLNGEAAAAAMPDEVRAALHVMIEYGFRTGLADAERAAGQANGGIA